MAGFAENSDRVCGGRPGHVRYGFVYTAVFTSSVGAFAVTGPSCEEKSVEERLAGWVGSRSSGAAGVSGRILGGAADHALRSPRTWP